MHRGAVKRGQDPNRVKGFPGAPGLVAIVGQGGRAGHMQPQRLARHADPALVEMRHPRGDERGLDGRLDRLQLGIGGGLALAQTARRDGLPKQIADRLLGTCIGQELLVLQVHAGGLEARAILHRLRGLCRELPGGGRGAVRAGFVPHAMLRHFQPLGGQLHDLATFHVQHRRLAQRGAALPAVVRQMLDHVIGMRDDLTRGAGVTALTARFFAAPAAQALGALALLAQLIPGRRLMAVVAVLIEARFQHLDARGQVGDLLLVVRAQRLHQLHDRFRSGRVHGQDFFTRRNRHTVSTIHAGRRSARLSSYRIPRIVLSNSGDTLLLGGSVIALTQ